MVNVQLPAGSTPAPRFTGGERMVDREKLMTTLQYRINEARNKGSKVTTIFISTLSDCMTLLKEQEEKRTPKPIIHGHKEEYWGEEEICPDCGKRWQSLIIDTTNFCPGCGRAVKWE